jgi:hypothetical protein
LYSVANGAASVHVKGTYTWPHSRLRVNVGLLQPGQIAGLVVDDGDPMLVTDTGGKMYVRITRAFAAYYYHQPAACPALCGKYTMVPQSFARSLINSMGVTFTLQTLLSMALKLAKSASTTYHGQPAPFGEGARIWARRLRHLLRDRAKLPAQGRRPGPFRPDLQQVEQRARPARAAEVKDPHRPALTVSRYG